MVFSGTMDSIKKQLDAYIALFGKNATIEDIKKSARRIRLISAERKQFGHKKGEEKQ